MKFILCKAIDFLLGKKITLSVFLIASISMYAQTTVRGKVTDDKGEAIIGASVVVKGTTNGTISNFDGDYLLTVNSGRETLMVSYIGYKSQEIAVGGRTVINVKLSEDSEVLDEVVVVGYGTQKKVNVTGSISSVDAKAFSDKGAVNNPLQALQGQVAGMTVSRSSSSAPGREGWSFNIRGNASINNTSTLVLIDGIPGNINDINPDDIQSMDVLKDAAAAIYGSRAAGGVVLITTKRGKAQKPQVTYKGNIDYKVAVAQYKWMSMSQWAHYVEETSANDNNIDGSTFLGAHGAFPYNMLHAMKTMDPRFINTVQKYSDMGGVAAGINDIGFMDYDLADATWGNYSNHSHSIQISGGNDYSTYNLSLGYMHNGSPLKWGDDQSKRYNVRLNNDFKINKWFDIATNIAYERRNTVYPSLRPSEINGNPPGSPLQTIGGQAYGWANNTNAPLRALLGGSTFKNVNSFTVSIQPIIRISKDLNFVGQIAYNPWDTFDNNYENKIQWYDYNDVPYTTQISPSTNWMRRDAKTVLKENYQGYFEYKKTFLGSHSVAAMAGASYEKERAESFGVRSNSLSTSDIHSIASTLTDASTITPTDAISVWALGSYFSRLNYGYKERYLFEVLGRYDGSSRFLQGYRWSPFYGSSFGWRASEENWMKDLAIFDNLKFRASYGEAGNQNGIGIYDGYALINKNVSSGITHSFPIFGPDATSGTAVTQSLTQANVVALDRTWEVIKTTNVGLDFAVLNNKLSGSFDYFWKLNDGMLVSVVYPSVLGATAPRTNSGEMKVEGWELSLNWRDKINGFTYFVGFNLSDNWNKLTKMENASVKSLNAITNTLIDYPTGTYWGLSWEKLIETQEELDAYKQLLVNADGNKLPNFTTVNIGDSKYRDLDGDGDIDYDDIKLLGDNALHYNYALNFGGEFKGFDFSLILQGVGKATIVRNSDNAISAPGRNTYQNQGATWWGRTWSTIGENPAYNNSTFDYYGEQTAPVFQSVNKDPQSVPRWSKTQHAYNWLYSDAWFRTQNGAYMRLKNITLGYTLPKTLTKRLSIEKLRLNFTGTDLFEFTKSEDGWDPENTSQDPFGGTVGSVSYPFARSFAFGIDITF